MSTIALCMMAKNEEATIGRALASAKPWVDAWLVADTGSTDGTPAVARSVMDGLPGTVVHHDWSDFGCNRTLALQAAMELGTDYILVMDADQTLRVDDSAFSYYLEKDGYDIAIHHGALVYPHPWLLRRGLAWRWEGATHEYLTCDAPYTSGALSGIYLVEHADSHRRTTGAKPVEDLALLEAAYAADPNDSRTVFYLAQTCADMGKWSCALKYYRQRVALGGWMEEVWCAQYRIGQVHEACGTWEFAQDAYMRAVAIKPGRAEPLYRLGRGLLMRRQFMMAHVMFNEAIKRTVPPGALFVEGAVYGYLCRWGLSMCLRLMGLDNEAAYVEDGIIGVPTTPEDVVAEILGSRISKSIGKLP